MASPLWTVKRMRIGWWAVALLATLSPSALAEGKKLALLIGVDRYPEGSGFTSLPYTERDVEQLAEVLLNAGYRPEHVRVLTLKRGNENTRFLPTQRNVRREFHLLADDRTPDDSLLVALSGHGITRRVGGKPAAFFAPIDADLADPDSLISLDELYASLEQSEARTKVLLVDACRNEPTEGRAAAMPFASAPPPPSIAALFACSDGEVAWDAADLGGGHGVFFHYVIEGLRGDADASPRDDKVSLAELLAYTQDRVPDYVSSRRGKRQMPILLGHTGRITLLDRSGPRPADVLTSRATGMKLKLIPAGAFDMGSDDSDRDPPDNEQVQVGGQGRKHRVRITHPFYLGMTEVTVGQFRRVVASAGLKTEAERDGKGAGWDKQAGQFRQDPKYTWRNPGFAQADDHPVTNVSWNDAVAYCNALSALEGLPPYYRVDGREVTVLGGDGYRLPTEAEWEYACRAGTTTRYQGGDDPETLASAGNVADATLKEKEKRLNLPTIAGRDGFVYTAPVGRLRANAFGLYDMHGNVWEWCWDGYRADYYKDSPGADPSGPPGASDRVIRGGSWTCNPVHARSAARNGLAPDFRDFNQGFRVARVRSGQ
jgi:formylglycine-generating enzyme required for sulfatase activity